MGQRGQFPDRHRPEAQVDAQLGGAHDGGEIPFLGVVVGPGRRRFQSGQCTLLPGSGLVAGQGSDRRVLAGRHRDPVTGIVGHDSTAGSGPQSLWENVVALRLHAIVRSPEPVSGGRAAAAQSFQLGGIGALQTPADGYVRRLYTTTVRLENPSAARERW